MGISRDSRHKRRATGGKRALNTKKRNHEMGRPASMTKLGAKRIHVVRTRGGNKKYRALRLEAGNFSWSSESVTRKTRVVDVVYNATSNELIRTKTLVRGCIIQIDATPYRQWYEAHYGLPLGKKKQTTDAKKDDKKAADAKKTADAAKKASPDSKKKAADAKKTADDKKDAKKKTDDKKGAAPDGKKDTKKDAKKDDKKDAKKDAKKDDKKDDKKPADDKKDGKKKGDSKKVAAAADSKKEESKKEEPKKDDAKSKKGNKKGKVAKEEEDPLKKKKSRHVIKKLAARKELSKIDPQLIDQFTTGRLFARVSSRPGQSGRADGYILEGQELAFYLRKLKAKKGGA